MGSIKIGIQGNFGSTNHRAAELFAERRGWRDFEIVPLTTTENVLRALTAGEVEYGTFAWESARGGLVAETQAAIKKFAYVKLDELDFQIDHGLLVQKGAKLDVRQPVYVYSHPQALKCHRSFLEQYFENGELREEIDTAYAAEQLAAGKYPANSVAIARLICAELYGLDIFLSTLPTNAGLWTKIFLVQRAAKTD